VDFCFFSKLLGKDLTEKISRRKGEQNEWKKGNSDKGNIDTIGERPKRGAYFFPKKEKRYDEEEKSDKQKIQKKKSQEFNRVIKKVFLWGKQGVDTVFIFEKKAFIFIIFVREGCPDRIRRGMDFFKKLLRDPCGYHMRIKYEFSV